MKEQKNKSEKVKRLVFSAIMISLATVLSMIKVFQLPLGGSITFLSMLPVVMVSICYGTKHGLCTSFVYSVIQLGCGIFFDGIFGWGLTWYSLLGTILLDYIIAFTVIGLGGMFAKKGTFGIVLGTTLSLTLRFLCHFLSGVIIFGIFTDSNTWIYSLTYNGSFMLPELIFTCIGASALFNVPQIKRYIK